MYYRLLNENMTSGSYPNEEAFKYKLGLNVDPLPFNADVLCAPGGLHFCKKFAINRWVGRNTLIADVTIPPDALVAHRVYQSKASKIIIRNIRSIWSEATPGSELYKLLIATNIPVPNKFRKLQTLLDVLQSMPSEYTPEYFVSLFNSLLEYGADAWKTAMDLNYQIYCACPNKTLEMTQHILAKKFSFSYDLYALHRYIPYEHLSEEQAKFILKLFPSYIEYMEPTEKQCWFILKQHPRNMKYIKSPTYEMVKYILDISHSMHKYVESWLYVNKFKQLQSHKFISSYSLNDSDALNQHFPAMRSLIAKLPLIQFMLRGHTVIHGSFIRWMIKTTMNQGTVPTIADVYVFLETSDIDVHIKCDYQFRMRDFVYAIKYLNGHIEKCDSDLYHSNVHAGKCKCGHYYIWIPSKIAKYKWVRYDVMITTQKNMDKQFDFTINTSTMRDKRLNYRYLSRIMAGVIRPFNVLAIDPSKVLIRIGKLLNAGFTLEDDQKPAIKFMLDTVIQRMYYFDKIQKSDMSCPSTAMVGVIVKTKHLPVDITKEMFNNDETIVYLKSWLGDFQLTPYVD